MNDPDISRRHFLIKSTGAFTSLNVARTCFAKPRLMADPSAPMRILAGVHLFVDDHLIESEAGLRRRINQPTRLPQPIVTGREDGNFQPYLSVIRDPATGRFRMWYDVAVNGSQSHIGYLESTDGIQWMRPHRVLEDPSPVGFGCCVLDDGPGFRDAARRYKLAYWMDGLRIAFSPDGFSWTRASSGPVLTGIGDIVFLARDPVRNRYLLTCKVDSSPADGYKGRTPNASEGYRRCVGQSVSADCVTWEPARRVIKPDERDDGITEFYSIGGVIARGDLLIGLLKVLRDDLPHDEGQPARGVGYTVLAWSRDGETWERDRQPFLDRNAQPGAWDRAMTWGDYQLLQGDETFLYYGGYARGHKVERFTERQIGLARMRRDRYVAREAAEVGGSLRTRSFVLSGAGLNVNADVRGQMRIRVLREDGKPFAGFDGKDCEVIQGDHLGQPVRWRRPLQALRGRTVKLEFVVHDAKLYGFEVREQP